MGSSGAGGVRDSKRLTHEISSRQLWEEEVLYTTGDDYFASLIAAIDKSRISIDFESYIYEKGVLGDRLTDAFVRARTRGVRVRLIVDGFGSPGFAWTYWPRLKSEGIKVHFFRVFPWIVKRLPGDPESVAQRMLARLRKVNRGNHRKFCVIDENELWVGSFNVSDFHLAEVYGPNAWKDIGVRVRGEDVKYALRSFKRAFHSWNPLTWRRQNPKLLLLNDSFLHKRRSRHAQITRLKKAKHRVWLATPYFVPVGQIYRLLVKKARQGVDVRLTVPLKNDLWFMPWISVPLLRELATKGVKVFVYQPRFSHQKVFVIDDWICIGSTNLNHRSFLHDLEMDVVITHQENAQKILDEYVHDQTLSQPFDSTDWSHLPLWKRFLGFIFKFAKYWS